MKLEGLHVPESILHTAQETRKDSLITVSWGEQAYMLTSLCASSDPRISAFT